MKILKHIIIILLVTFTTNLSQAQQDEFIEIKDPIIDSALEIRYFTSLYAPLYIVNKDYVIYQNNSFIKPRTQKIIYADMSSFKIPRNNVDVFALDKNGVYVEGDFVRIDTTEFKIIGGLRTIIDNYWGKLNYFWKTKENRLFLNTTEIKEIDAESFQALGNDYYKDKNYVYYIDNQITKVERVDINSFICDYSHQYDKNYIYKYGKIVTKNGDTLRPINYFLAKTATNVLAMPQGQMVFDEVQPDIDIRTIQPLSKYYSMDKNFVYYGKIKTAISPKRSANFKIWNINNQTAFISDGKNVYLRNNILPGIDPKTFGVVHDNQGKDVTWFYDKNGIYTREFDTTKQERATIKLPFQYSEIASKANTFLSWKKADWFRYGSYIIYKDQAYDTYEKELYRNLTQEQIKLAKEDKLNLKMLPNDRIVEKKTFGSLHRLYEADNRIFYKDKVTIADAQTLERINGKFGLYKDKSTIYYYVDGIGLMPIKGIDFQTTTTVLRFLADKDYIYLTHGNSIYRIIKNDNVEIVAIFTNGGNGQNIDWYLLKNSDGYWLLYVRDTFRIRHLGNTLSEEIQERLKKE